jgi:hypothetical protein
VSEREATTAERRLRDGLRPCLITFLSMRLGLTVLSAIAIGVIPPRAAVIVPGWGASAMAQGWGAVFTALERQDAQWFLRIADGGYAPGDGSAAFFPLYPLAVRVVSWLVGGHPLLASLLVSNLAYLGALLVLYDLTVREFDESVARRTIVYISIFPTAFFFLAPYSESLFLLLTLVAFREARRDRWTTAALAGALAAMTRSVGVVLVIALAALAIEQWRSQGKRLWPRLVASAAVVLGPLIYLGWWEIAHGAFLTPLDAQANWQRVAASPITTVVRSVDLAFHVATENQGYWIIDLLVTAFVVVPLIIWWRRIPLPYLIYAGVSLLIPLSYPFPPRPLLSVPRFVAVLFPAFWAMADATERHRLSPTLVVATFAGGFALLATLFMNWWYIF